MFRHPDLLGCIGTQYRAEVLAALAKVFDADLAAVSAILEQIPDVYAGARRRLLVEEMIRRRIGLLAEVLRGQDL